jgi:transposase
MVPGRKSDQKDSEWLAYLMRAELIKPSYIPDREYQELRTLTRLRARLTQTQTAFKNRAHKILQLCNIRLASKLTDLFGSSGMKILDALVNGVSIDEAIEKCDRRVKKQRDEIKASIIGTLSQTDIFELKICLDNIKLLEEQIKQVDEKIASKVDKDLVDKLCKIPGIATHISCNDNS